MLYRSPFAACKEKLRDALKSASVINDESCLLNREPIFACDISSQ